MKAPLSQSIHRKDNEEIEWKHHLAPNPHFHLCLLMSQIVWKLSLMVSSLLHTKLEFMLQLWPSLHTFFLSHFFSLREEGWSLATVQGREDSFQFCKAPGLKKQVSPPLSPHPNLGTPTEAPGLEPRAMKSQSSARTGCCHWHLSDSLILFLDEERFKGSVLENPSGRGIFCPMQISLCGHLFHPQSQILGVDGISAQVALLPSSQRREQGRSHLLSSE